MTAERVLKEVNQGNADMIVHLGDISVSPLLLSLL